jgi:quercetin dioxygenase-like cupin family protein
VAQHDQLVIRSTDIPGFENPPGAMVRLINGDEYGLGNVSLIVSEYPAGADTIRHRHPHISTIVVVEGHGQFTVEGTTVGAGAGDLLVVPANAWHSFRNDGDGVLRIVGAHDSGHHETSLE